MNNDVWLCKWLQLLLKMMMLKEGAEENVDVHMWGKLMIFITRARRERIAWWTKKGFPLKNQQIFFSFCFSLVNFSMFFKYKNENKWGRMKICWSCNTSHSSPSLSPSLCRLCYNFFSLLMSSQVFFRLLLIQVSSIQLDGNKHCQGARSKVYMISARTAHVFLVLFK